MKREESEAIINKEMDDYLSSPYPRSQAQKLAISFSAAKRKMY